MRIFRLRHRHTLRYVLDGPIRSPPTPLRLTPWRPRRAPPMPLRLRRALALGQVWRLPPHPDGAFLLARTRGGPSLWLLTDSSRRPAPRPAALLSAAPRPPAPTGPWPARALRMALTPIFPLPDARRVQQDLLRLLAEAAGGSVLFHAGLRRHPVPSFACLRPRHGQHVLSIVRAQGGGDWLHGNEIPRALACRLVPGLHGDGGRTARGEAEATSAHVRLAALAAVARRLGLAPDNLLLRRLGGA